ncbi:MAG TPA: zinc ABC transporter substrate-binding protein [Nostocaceae cyanobacterium]|nr:zinc ABC transporter substrate-binding protein [Nostocaceae cyanobacterium]
MFTKKISLNKFFRTTLLVLTYGILGCTNQTINTAYNQTTTIKKIDPNLPQVVATTSVICDLTQQIAGETIQLTCLIPPQQESRSYQPQPQDKQAISQANLILYHGYNFEPSLIKTIQANKKPIPKIAVAQIAVPNPQKLKQGNRTIIEPHIWHNPKNTIKMVEVINTNLKKIAPKNSQLYTNNTKNITNELNQLDQWIRARLASIPAKNRNFAITEEAMLYYAKAYKLPYTSILMGINNQQNLNTTRVKNLAQNIQKSKIRTIFIDTKTNPDIFAPIAEAANITIFSRKLYLHGLDTPENNAETYQKMMTTNTRIIVEGLGGTYLKFTPKTQ